MTSFDAQPLPPVPQPKGIAYYLGTWSGRIIVINTLVFLAMSFSSKNFFMPTSEVLLGFGAKDPVLLARGEYWRYITPVFVHIGFLHYAMNNLSLFYIGYQIEAVLGATWFLVFYLLTGTLGNIASSVFTVAVSAGASGALFGLLGCGFFLERAIGRRMQEITGRRQRHGIYTVMAVINILMGLAFPGIIDNAAHLGGMFTGIILTYAMVNIRPNRLSTENLAIGWAALLLLTGLAAGGLYYGASPTFLRERLVQAAAKADDNAEAYHLLTQGIRLAPDSKDLYFKRGRVLLFAGEDRAAFLDLREAASDAALRSDFETLIAELEQKNMDTQAWQVRRIVQYNAP